MNEVWRGGWGWEGRVRLGRVSEVGKSGESG